MNHSDEISNFRWIADTLTFIVLLKEHEINALKWRNRGNGIRARRLQIGCNLAERNVEARQVINFGERPKHNFMVQENMTTNTELDFMLNRKWRQEIIDTEYINERAITATIVVNHQRIKLMSVYFSHSGYADHHVENMYRTIKKTTNYTKHAYQLLVEISLLSQPGCGTDCRCWKTHTQRKKQERWLDDTLTDVTQFYSTQHDVLKESWETNDLQITRRNWEANRPHHNQEKTLEIQQRCRSQIHDAHGQWSQMCHGNIHDHYSEEGWPS